MKITNYNFEVCADLLYMAAWVVVGVFIGLGNAGNYMYEWPIVGKVANIITFLSLFATIALLWAGRGLKNRVLMIILCYFIIVGVQSLSLVFVESIFLKDFLVVLERFLWIGLALLLWSSVYCYTYFKK